MEQNKKYIQQENPHFQLGLIGTNGSSYPLYLTFVPPLPKQQKSEYEEDIKLKEALNFKKPETMRERDHLHLNHMTHLQMNSSDKNIDYSNLNQAQYTALGNQWSHVQPRYASAYNQEMQLQRELIQNQYGLPYQNNMNYPYQNYDFAMSQYPAHYMPFNFSQVNNANFLSQMQPPEINHHQRNMESRDLHNKSSEIVQQKQPDNLVDEESEKPKLSKAEQLKMILEKRKKNIKT